MTMNVFNSAGTAFLGPQPFAFNRAAMLAGSPRHSSRHRGHRLRAPSRPTCRPTSTEHGSACGRARLRSSSGRAEARTACTASTSTSRRPRTRRSRASPRRPQPASRSSARRPARASQSRHGSSLDGIGDRFDVPCRLPELRRPRVARDELHRQLGRRRGRPLVRDAKRRHSGPVTVFQESTYQPDTTWRWMGSAAMDQAGRPRHRLQRVELDHGRPEIRYAGRLASDPLNTLAQGEATLFAGAGSQSGDQQPLGRLQRPDRRPERRLHVLVHERVLPVRLVAVQLADPDRELQASRPAAARHRHRRRRLHHHHRLRLRHHRLRLRLRHRLRRHLGPVSQITSTGATCGQFSAGTATTLSAVTFTVRNGRIRSVSPSAFDYWVRVSRSAGSNSAVIPQSITTGNFSTLFGLGSGTAVFNAELRGRLRSDCHGSGRQRLASRCSGTPPPRAPTTSR